MKKKKLSFTNKINSRKYLMKLKKSFLKNLLYDLNYFKNLYSNFYNKNINYYEFFQNIIIFLKGRFVNKGENLFKINNLQNKIIIVVNGNIMMYKLDKNIDNKFININENIYLNEIFEMKKRYNENFKFNINNLDFIFDYYYKKDKLEDFIFIKNLFYDKIISEDDILLFYNEDNLIKKYKLLIKFKKKEEFKYFSILNENLILNKISRNFNKIIAKEDSFIVLVEKIDLFNHIKEYLFNKELLIFFNDNFKMDEYENFIEEALYNLKRIQFNKNHILFKKNNTIENIYVLINGMVEIYDISEDKKKIPIRLLCSKQIIGFENYYENGKYNFNAKIISNKNEIYELNINHLKILLKNKLFKKQFDNYFINKTLNYNLFKSKLLKNDVSLNKNIFFSSCSINKVKNNFDYYKLNNIKKKKKIINNNNNYLFTVVTKKKNIQSNNNFFKKRKKKLNFKIFLKNKNEKKILTKQKKFVKKPISNFSYTIIKDNKIKSKKNSLILLGNKIINNYN